MKLVALTCLLGVLAATNGSSLAGVRQPVQRQNQVVTLSVSVGGRSPATLSVQVGSKATISLTSEGTLALVPSVNTGELTLEILELTSRDPEAWAPSATLTLLPGGRGQFVRFGTSLEVGWLGESSAAPENVTPTEDCTQCCVTCETITYCACKVVTICSYCCCLQCCHIITAPGGAPVASCAGCAVAREPAVKIPRDRR